MKIRHIFLFSGYNINGISTRYRGVYVLDELSKCYSIKTTFIYPGYKATEIIRFIIAYLTVLFTFRNHTLVIYQKIYTQGIYSRLLKVLVRLKPKGSVYDTDNADYLRYPDKNIYYFMRSCQMCTVGSAALETFTKQFNSNVLHITSPIILHNNIKTNRNKILHIGWVGDYGINNGYTPEFSHKVSLNTLLFPILLEFDFIFKLTLMGIKNPNDKIEIENYFKYKTNIILDIPQDLNWLDEVSIYNRIREFDIGISPLVPHAFNVAKSAFKVKQYLSCGVPVLASPVGENMTFIKNDYNGYLCDHSGDFKDKILHILSMPNEAYDRLRKNTRLNISTFSMESYCEILMQNIG